MLLCRSLAGVAAVLMHCRNIAICPEIFSIGIAIFPFNARCTTFGKHVQAVLDEAAQATALNDSRNNRESRLLNKTLMTYIALVSL